MTAGERELLLTQYRAMRCDVLRQGTWTSLDHVPSTPTFVISAWNPGGEPASDTVNRDLDHRLQARLAAAGIPAVRTRGRGTAGSEEGWLIPHEAARSLALVREFGQLAGIVQAPQGRRVLWADGTESALDEGACDIPDVEPR